MDKESKEEFDVSRDEKQRFYDKRLILRIVKEVEEGLPRRDANRIYGLGKSTLDGWMRDYGSPNYHSEIKRRAYSNLQKRSIAAAVDQGRMSISEARVAHGIRTEKTIREWVLRYRKEKVELCPPKDTAMPKKTPPTDNEEVQALRRALEEAELRIKALNTLIDVAEEQLKVDIRKKSGAKQSRG